MNNQNTLNPKINDLLATLEGMTLSKAWRGYGSSIFFEFGSLDEAGKGEITVNAQTSWEVQSLENEERISASETDWDQVDKQIKELEGEKAIGVEADTLPFKLSFESVQLVVNPTNDTEKVLVIHFKSNNEYLQLSQDGWKIEKGD